MSATARRRTRPMSSRCRRLRTAMSPSAASTISRRSPRASSRTWARILRRVPDAAAVLKTHQFSDAGTARADAGCVRRAWHRAGAHRAPRRLGAPRLSRGIQRVDHGARPVSLFRRADHLRGAVDGRSDLDAAGRNLRLATLGQPHVQCRASDWVVPLCTTTSKQRSRKRSDPRCACRPASGIARTGEGKPAL